MKITELFLFYDMLVNNNIAINLLTSGWRKHGFDFPILRGFPDSFQIF